MTADHRELTHDEYHADTMAIGASMIEDFIESRRLYHGRYIAKTIPKKEPTPALELGTLVHLRMLEPEKYLNSIAIAPLDAPDGRSKKWWSEFEEINAGKRIISHEQARQVHLIAESVLSRRWAHRIRERDGQPEFSIFWTDAETGLRLKCLVDWFNELICTDLKTVYDASPAGFARAAANLGYYRKKHHYLDGIQAFTGQPTPLMHIAVCTSSPYQCGAYDLTDNRRDGTSNGRAQWRRALRKIAECMESGDWSDPWEREVIELEAPAFAYAESAYQM